MFIESKTWAGYPDEDMAGVYSRVVPTGYRSPVAPKRNRKLARAACKIGKSIGEAIATGLNKALLGRLTGTVVFYREDRGFGFIKQSSGKDIFFHIRDAAEPGLTYLTPGERVSYEISEKDGKPAAVKISLIGGRK